MCKILGIFVYQIPARIQELQDFTPEKKLLKAQKTNMILMFIGPCIILIVEYRKTNLITPALLFHYLMLNMFRMLIHPSSGACDLFVELFHGLYCSGSMCVGVTVTVTVTPTHIEPEQYNP